MLPINPDKQTVASCLKGKTYYVDFYQRDYVWTKNTVDIFLDDIFYSFETSYMELQDAELTQELLNKFNWYYLNVIITNNISGKRFIVDGQQRLSTLVLLAVKLYHDTKNENLKNILKSCICGSNIFNGDMFYLDNEKRKDIMTAIFNNETYTSEYKNKTEETLYERFKDISKYINEKAMSENALNFFIPYFLERLVLVELEITQEDTPMVFEVINDRGEDLKPFEILKGKLIGKLDKNDTDIFSAKWDDSMRLLVTIEDEFFTDYLKSKFIFKRNSDLESVINNLYHRYIFENNDIGNVLGFSKSSQNSLANIKSFLTHDLVYYSKLYANIKYSSNEFIRYNKINNLSRQYQIILSACNINDTEEDMKIASIAKEYDRLHLLLRLNNIYDSNMLQEISYTLNEKIKNKALNDYRNVFDEILIEKIKERTGITQLNSLLDYNTFLKNNYANVEKRFLRYFLSRIEHYLCTNSQQTMQYDIEWITTKTGQKTGFHIEHILSRNNTNKTYFATEEEFEYNRNLLGGLLLLQGSDNISSGNEEYSDKLRTYSSGLMWGHSLCSAFYHNNNSIKLFNQNLQQKCGFVLNSIDVFDANALESRNILLYNLVKIIWEIV